MSERKLRIVFVGKIGLIFLLAGILSLIYSLYSAATQSQVLAFVGLGLTFWGVLFLMITPTRYIEASLLPSTAIASYLTIDRLIKDLKYSGKGYYIRPYSKEDYVAKHPSGLEDSVVFVAAENDSEIPTNEVIAKNTFVIDKPEGVLIDPPGLGLLKQIEKESHKDFLKVPLTELCEVLPRVILQNLALAMGMEMAIKENQVKLRISGSHYKNLNNDKNNLRSVSLLGCPITSAIACALAKASGKPVVIQEFKMSQETSAIEATCLIVQG